MAKPDGAARTTTSKARLFYQELIKARRLALSSSFGINRARAQNFQTIAPYMVQRPAPVVARRTQPIID